MARPDISVILSLHAEGAMAGCSVHSLIEAADAAAVSGLKIEKLAVLDVADDPTREIARRAEGLGFTLLETDFGDQAKARNAAVSRSTGAYIAFLDGDDLWSYNWLIEAHGTCCADADRVIAHPEVDMFFQGNNNCLFTIDQDAPEFDATFLRYGNYWDALCMAPRRAYLDHPFCDRDVDGGYAYEDWHWNCATFAAGFLHKVSPGTIHFKRRRAGSQTIVASQRRVLQRMTPLLRFDYAGPSVRSLIK